MYCPVKMIIWLSFLRYDRFECVLLQLVKEANEKTIVFSDGAYSAMIEQVAPKGREDIIDYVSRSLF